MKKVTLLIILIMFYFSKNNVSADYDKVFFDFKINDISLVFRPKSVKYCKIENI